MVNAGVPDASTLALFERSETMANDNIFFGFLIGAKVLVVLIFGDVAMHLFQRQSDGALTLGLLLGSIAQLAIPPRNRWKRQLVWLVPIVLAIGLAHHFGPK